MHEIFNLIEILLFVGLLHDLFYYTSMENIQKQTLKIGLVGVGRFGARHLEKWKTIDGTELLGFNDIDPEKQVSVEANTSIPFYELDDLIELCDIIDIVVPTVSHYDIALKAIQAGKHVFIEKPFTDTVQQAKQIADAAEKNDIRVGIGHIERFNTAYTSMEALLKDVPEEIIAVRQGPFIPCVGLDVSVVKELMIHDIDLLLKLIPDKIVKIKAKGSIEVSNNIDVAKVKIFFAGGSEASLFASRNADERRRSFDCISGGFLYHANLMDHKLNMLNNSIVLEKRDAIIDELSDFIDAVRNGKRHIVSERDGLKSISLANQIEEIILKSLS